MFYTLTLAQGEALRDLEYTKQMHSNNREKDAFKLVSSVQRDHLIMEETELLEYIKDVRKGYPDAPNDLESPDLLEPPRGSDKVREKLQAVVIALCFGVLGGVALLFTDSLARPSHTVDDDCGGNLTFRYTGPDTPLAVG